MTYQYRTLKRRNSTGFKKEGAGALRSESNEEQEVMGLIQGMTPDSIEEWRVSVSLEKYNIEYRYQVEIDGGRNLRGGQVLDFEVYIPNAVPLQVMGEYWHAPAELDDEERILLSRLEQIYGVEPIVLWSEELPDQVSCNQVIRERCLAA
jgi:hypothetical protein